MLILILCFAGKKNFTLLLNLMGFLRGGYRFKKQIARGFDKKVEIRLRYTYPTHCKFPKIQSLLLSLLSAILLFSEFRQQWAMYSNIKHECS